jgi:hypothetical protein
MDNLKVPLPTAADAGCVMTDLPKSPKIKHHLAFLMATLAEASATRAGAGINALMPNPSGP